MPWRFDSSEKKVARQSWYESLSIWRLVHRSSCFTDSQQRWPQHNGTRRNTARLLRSWSIIAALEMQRRTSFISLSCSWMSLLVIHMHFQQWCSRRCCQISRLQMLWANSNSADVVRMMQGKFAWCLRLEMSTTIRYKCAESDRRRL